MVEMGNVWDRTTAFLSENARALTPVALAGLLVPATLKTLIDGATATCNSGINPFIAGIVSIALSLVTIWAQLAITAMVLQSGAAAGRTATASLGRAVAAMLVIFVVFAVLGLPFIYAAYVNGSMSVTDACGTAVVGSAATRLAGWPLALYGGALALVAMVVIIRLTMLYPVIIAEGGIIVAIRRAFAVSRGLFWKLFGVWLLFVIVYLVAAAAITSGVGAALGFFIDMGSPVSPGRIVVAILGGAVTTMFTLIVAVFSAKLYLAVAAGRADAAAA